MSQADQPRKQDSGGYTTLLGALLRDPVLNEFNSDKLWSREATSAALMLAQTLGYCRLYGITVPGEWDGSLPVTAALAAAQTLKTILQETIQESDEFPERWESCGAQAEMELLSCDLLRTRMNAWAVFLAVDEAGVAAARDNDPGGEELSQLLTELVTEIRRLDKALRRDEDLLATVLETRLIDNWRAMLAEEYQVGLPWWLDGTLERAVEKILRQGNQLPVDQSAEPLRSAAPSHRLTQIRRFRKIQSIPPAPVLVSQSAALPPHRGHLAWRSKEDLTGDSAILMLPTQRDAGGSTRCRLQFSGQNKEALLAQPVALGAARAIIQSRELESLPGAVAIEAVFVVEEIALLDGQFPLRVGGQLWFEVPHEEAAR